MARFIGGQGIAHQHHRAFEAGLHAVGDALQTGVGDEIAGLEIARAPAHFGAALAVRPILVVHDDREVHIEFRAFGRGLRAALEIHAEEIGESEVGTRVSEFVEEPWRL